MNYKTIKELQNEIRLLKAIRAAQTSSDKTEMHELEQSIDSKTAALNCIISAIPNTYEGKIIYLKVVKKYKWKAIALKVTGNVNDYDTIRKACDRYNW